MSLVLSCSRPVDSELAGSDDVLLIEQSSLCMPGLYLGSLVGSTDYARRAITVGCRISGKINAGKNLVSSARKLSSVFFLQDERPRNLEPAV
jgi:hypothetical protein